MQKVLFGNRALLNHRSLLLRNAFSFTKICASADEALSDVKDGSKIIMGGFGICGIPENSILYLNKKGVKDLTVVSNTCGKQINILNLLILILNYPNKV